MIARRLLTLGPSDEALWVRLYIHQIDEIIGDVALQVE